MEELAGVTAIDIRVRFDTVRVAEPLRPLCVAVMIALPAPTPVAKPAVTVATLLCEDLQVAEAVRSFCEPSL